MTNASHAAFYESVLSSQRLRKSSVVDKRDLSLETASDRGRVMFCTAFRRLQSKTQVFPQEANAAVRTRLTHSLEVASIGRYIAEKISPRLLAEGHFGSLEKSESEGTFDRSRAFVSFVEIACLMHDLGNPPFGHFGELAIRGWFSANKQKFEKLFGPSNFFSEGYSDFLQFDGNPQGFRIATRLQWNIDEFGLNLTLSQLAATLKYPWLPSQIGTLQNGNRVKKANVFHSEAGLLSKIQTGLSLKEGARHPLAYVMEAADDISYCLSDIEDAMEKGVVQGSTVIEALKQQLGTLTSPEGKRIAAKLPDTIQDNSWFLGFRTEVTNVLVARAADLYFENHQRIVDGEYFSLLNQCETAKTLLGAVRDFSERHLYTSRLVRERELIGYEVITGILERFGQILELRTDEAKEYLLDRRNSVRPEHALIPTLVSFLPIKHLKVYEFMRSNIGESLHESEKRALEWLARAHLLVDFLSGMTDDFAIVIYRKLYSGGSYHP